jgi:mannose-6-phosphate isomerase-like protein (cupin superfamily)
VTGPLARPDGFVVRRVVLGRDPLGRVRVDDGVPTNIVQSPTGFGCADLWTLSGPPLSIGDGFDPPKGPFALEPEPGGMTWRVIRLPRPDPALPREEQFLHDPNDPRFSGEKLGMHTTDTIDFEVVLNGAIELEVESGCVLLGPGDCVVQRGTKHRWRVVGGNACTYMALMLRAEGAPPSAFDLAPRPGRGTHPRRVVTGLDDQGRSVIVADASPPCTATVDGATTSVLYETGGALSGPLQGGDEREGDIADEPIGRGVSWRLLEIAPGARTVQPEGTLDLVMVLAGEAEVDVGGDAPVRLGPNDCLVNQGVATAWRSSPSNPVRLATAMIAAR